MNQLSRSLAMLTGLAMTASLAAAASQIAIGPGLISTAASGTNNVLAGNPDGGGSGVAPRFNGVAFAAAADGPVLYISDSAKHQVFRLVLNTGQVSAFAGNGNAGLAGDGGAATSAQLDEPSGIAIDAAGNVYIADTTRNVVRRVDTAGNISTAVGNGAAGTPPYTGDGPATSVQLSKPIGLAIDGSNNLYIADSTHGRILRLTGGSITTVAGNGGGGPFTDGPATAIALQLPAGLAVDSANNVYVSETFGHVIRLLSGGNLTTVAGQVNASGYAGDGGPAASARLNVPYGLAVDNGGAIYMSEAANQVVRKVTADTNRTINTIAGTNASGYFGDGGSALSARFNGPGLLSMDRATGNIYVVDTGNNAIRVVTGSAYPQTLPSAGASATLTVSNIGDQALAGAAVTASTGYAVTGGTCGSVISLPPGQSCTLTVQASGNAAGNLTVATGSLSSVVNMAVANGLRFVPVAPCRVVDTRLSGAQYGSFGAPTLAAGQRRDFDIRNSTTVGCTSTPVPAGTDVRAYSLNITAVPRAGILNYATVFPASSATPPFVSTLNSLDGRTKANAAIVPVDSSNTSIGVFATEQTDVVIDINGYYVPASASVSAAQAYYPLPPCRVSDTRRANGDFGGPFLTGSGALTPGQVAPTSRTIPVRGSACNVPSNATAYSLNITAVPRSGRLQYVSVWPSDQGQPFVSTLNSFTGTVTANAAIVPAAANGNITAYATENADLIVDINGYYAPPAAGGLSLYSVTPCRAYDSRLSLGALPAGASTQQISGISTCATAAAGASPIALPATAQSWVLNTTVSPTGQLVYLANWAHGTAQPLQSTLNAFDGSISSNLAVVPTVDGSISSYGTASTALILDVFGYFAP